MESKTQFEEILIDTSNRTNNQFKAIIQSDPKLERQDTLKGILHLVDEYRQIFNKISLLTAQQKTKNYHVVYNTISYITQILSYIQKSSFSFESIKPLVDCILSMENNLILADVKFLDKRTQLYLSLSKIYQEAQYYQPAVLLIEGAIKKYEDLRKIYELDPPVQKYISDILDNNIFIMKVLSIKFSIHANILNPNEWKKKTEQQIKDSTLQKKLICLIECLRTQTKKNSNIFNKNQKGFKEILVQQGFDLVKPSLDILSRGLQQMKFKIQNQLTIKQKNMKQTANQQQINQQISKKRQSYGKHIKQSEVKKASKNFPLQYHAQLITYAYQVKNQKALQQLLKCAMIRVECRRIQVPYVTDVKIQVSNTPHINAKEGYQKIPIDLNQANLKEQLKKLRKSGKTDPNAKAQIGSNQQQPVTGKDAKKGGKEVPVPAKQQTSNNDQPTQWELQQINHKYVYMYIKRSYSPQKAIYNIQLVLGHEEKGPVGYQDCRRIIVPYIQKNQKVITSQIQQYKGMRQSTQMVPYIILSHSENFLQNQEQKKSLIVDVQPIVGKNPMVPPKLGYNKLDMDLRQVPQQFIKMPGQSYTFLTYKTDYQFHLSSRLIQLYNSLMELQNSNNSLQKQTNLTVQQIDKYTELSITYSLDKLQQFFVTFQDTLKGILGQQFYLDKNDFLTNLTFEIWKKYLKEPLYQIEYIMEQRLNDQIIDYDYLLYKQIISRCKPIFLKGLKVLNLIMINNKKCDILLLSKISLELIKLLQENKQYYLASENARLALDRVRMSRDQYLSKGVQGISDRLLPYSISCNQILIEQTISKMKLKYMDQRLLIQKINKINKLANQGRNLSQQELSQAEIQWKQNRIKDQYDTTIEKISIKYSEFQSLLTAIDLDLSNLYFRVSLKHGDQLKKKGVNHTSYFPQGQLTGLADTLVKKLGFLQTKNNVKEQQNLKQLQSTLIKAQKLPPPKPQASRPQKRLIQQSFKNPYKLSLLLLNLAALNSSNDDKKYYLQQSLKSLKQCKQLQQRLMQNCVQNSIFIFSSIFDSQIYPEKSSYSTKPFDDLYNGIWPCEGDKASTPILISKNSQCIYLKLPPFVYKDKIHSKKINYMKLFGKVSANGVDVSTNCDELIGTGTKQPVGKTIKVSHLQPNNKYCFAVAPLKSNTNELMEIGKTSLDIPTHNPLSIPCIASNIAKVAYQIGEYGVAYQAARIIVLQYTQESQIIDPKNLSINKTIKLRLNQDKLQKTSLIQIRAIAQTLYVLALCQKNKLKQLKSLSLINKRTIQVEQKERDILNLLTLCSTLQPALNSPLTSVVLATSQLSSQFSQNVSLFQGLMITLVEKDFFSPQLRKFGTAVMRKLMSWGLQNNQISQVRRILYKWATRKWMVLGKLIKVPVEEKKDNKKGGKDIKQPGQQNKMIDKFCHYMVEKSPLLIEQYQDDLATVSEDYSDLFAIYSQAVKQKIQELAQSMDNGSQRAEQIINSLTTKVELADLLKDSINNIGKFNNTNKYYLEYNCKIIRKALQVSSKNDLKNITQKIQQFQVGQLSDQVKLSQEVFTLIFDCFENDIQFSPQSKQWMKTIMEKTQKKQLLKSIEIFQKYQQKMTSLTKTLKQTSFSFVNKSKDYDYLHMWLSQINHLKAISLIMNLQNSGSQLFKVSYKISPIYTAIQLLSLQNLKKKQKQVEIMGLEKAQYDSNSLNLLQKLFKYIAQSMYSAFCIENWVKCVNLITILTNFINFYQVTPFYHQKNKCWIYLSCISYMIVQMLKNIRKAGANSFKQRYHKKLQNSQLESVYKILKPQTPLLQLFDPLYDQYVPTYFIPQLSNATTKQPWFKDEEYQFLNMGRLVQIITYTSQVLNISNKNQVIIQILRQFSNVTQHSYSLELLPFLLNSQQFLSNQVQAQIQKVESSIKILDDDFQNQKKKHKKKRTNLLNEIKMPFQVQWQQNKKRLQQTLTLLKQQKSFVNTQMLASKSIVQQIQRDCNKAALNQKQQKRYVQQFGQDQQNIWKNYKQKSESNSLERQNQDRSSINKMNILSKNRKNLLKDLIAKYDQIYYKLRNNKTTKDTLSEILNRNQVANLWYALKDNQKDTDNIAKAFQFWNDSLATIYRKVNPIDNYLEIIKENENSLVQNIGFKQILISLPILYKIGQFCCHTNLNLQRKSIQFATSIIERLFKVSLSHPQHLLAFSNYRLKGFQNCYQRQFYDQNVQISQLRKALQFFILQAYDIFDNSQIVRVLPLITLYEHISIDIVKKIQYSFKAKIFKSLVLSRCGQIKDSSICLMFLAQGKDLPILWLQKSDSLKKEKGQNWYPQISFISENKPFYAPENKQPIQFIKNINFPQVGTYDLNLEIPILFFVAKQALLFKIYENQVIDNFDINEERISNLKNIEIQMRQSLRKFSVIQESQRLKQQFQVTKRSVQRGINVQQQQKIFQKIKGQIQNYMKTSGGYDQNQIQKYLTKKFDILRRNQIIQYILRTRYLVFRINQARNLSLNCFYILKNGLTNFKRYSYYARRVETGYDSEIQISTQSNTNAAGKKDDKKGSKKQPQTIKVPVKQQINPIQEQRLQKQAANLDKRTCPSSFWHLKLSFQLGYLLYRQNNFIVSLRIFQDVSKNSTGLHEQYYRSFSQSYIMRCKLRLGELNKQRILSLISEIQSQNYFDEEYLKLLIDFAQISDSQISLNLFQKSLSRSKQIWQNFGMKKYLTGINQQSIKRKYLVSDELDAQQEDLIKKKAKKPQDNSKKPGGKQQKKGAKKDDGKKKKQESKAQYKANLLKNHIQVNLFQDQEVNGSSQFKQYTFDKHPNYYPVNVYNQFGKKYLKCFIKYWELYLQIKNSTLDLISLQSHGTQSFIAYNQIQKLLKIAQSYPQNNIQSLLLLKIKSSFEKQQFLHSLSQKYIKKNLTKPEIKKIKIPFQDLPLNSRLVQIPSYFGFLTQNRKYLDDSITTFKKLISLIPQIPFILQNDRHLDSMVYQYANSIMLSIQYCGPLLPKYMQLNDQAAIIEQKKHKRRGLISLLVKLIKYTIDLSLAWKKLNEEYYSFSKKQLDPSAKIDEDISLDIKNIDKQCKNMYPLFLKQSTKPKELINSLDLLTYLLKIRRQAQVMTFSNPLQNTLRKCHRILSSSLSTYKQNCIIPLPDFQKYLDTFSNNLILAKSKRMTIVGSNMQYECYIYILGDSQNDEGIIYGKFNVEMNLLSKMLQNCYKIQSKLKQSVSLSQAVRERNYKQLQVPFSQLLRDLILIFGGMGPNTDPDSIIRQILSRNIVKLSQKSILTFINLLNGITLDKISFKIIKEYRARQYIWLIDDELKKRRECKMSELNILSLIKSGLFKANKNVIM